MRRLRAIRTTLACTAFLVASGCATLGGNVNGSFACRAPEGTCAPTSQIDQAAIAGASLETRQPVVAGYPEGARRLRIVIAGYRDAEGRSHEPRVVHAVLPEPAWTDWREPQDRRSIVRDLARALAPSRNEHLPAPAGQAPTSSVSLDPPLLPDVLVSPSQPVPAEPGSLPPGDGGSGVFPPLHGRVPHFSENPDGASTNEGDKR
jgi:conjugal transfer pilus assembly protein TraV